MEPLRDLSILRIRNHGDVGSQHPWLMLLVGIMRIGHRPRTRIALRLPLVCAAGTLRHLPFVLEQMFKVVVAPLLRFGGPRHLYAAGNSVAGNARLIRAGPAKALVLNRCTLRL